jgi:hypothetical protein
MSKREYAYSGRQHERANSDFSAATEQEVEKLVAEIGSVIRAAEPERRDELKELAETLVHEEMSTIPAQAEPAKDYFVQRSVNPLAGGNPIDASGRRFRFDHRTRRRRTDADRIVSCHLGRNHELGEKIANSYSLRLTMLVRSRRGTPLTIRPMAPTKTMSLNR